jgi:hypothetical protein
VDDYHKLDINCWNIDTQDKYDKWSVKNMLKINAYSADLNIKEKLKNVIMIYLFNNNLIINPWNGTCP